MDQQTLAMIAAVGVPALWLLSRLDLPKFWPQSASPAAALTEADFLPGDFAALDRLKRRAERYGNAAMWDAIGVIEAQFLTPGDGWEDAA